MSRIRVDELTWKDIRRAYELFKQRSPRSRSVDKRYAAKIPLYFETWLRHPERYDLPGVDLGADVRGKKRKAKRKARARKSRKGVVITDASIKEPVVSVDYVLSYDEIAKRTPHKRFYGYVVVYDIGDKAVIFVPAAPKSVMKKLGRLGFSLSKNLVSTIMKNLSKVPSSDDIRVRLRISIDLLRGLANALGIPNEKIDREIKEYLALLNKLGVFEGLPRMYVDVVRLYNTASAIYDLINARLNRLYGEYDWFTISALGYKRVKHLPNIPAAYRKKDGTLVIFEKDEPRYMFPRGIYRIVPKEKVKKILKKVVQIIEDYNGII